MSRRSNRSGKETAFVVTLVVLTSIVVLAAPPLLTTTSASSADTRIVDSDLAATDGLPSGADGVCTGATHPTIQSAVDVANPGDTILVCTGDYPERVDVNTSDLTLRADGDVNVSTMTEWAFEIYARHVTIQGFDIVAPGMGGIKVDGRNARILANTITAAKDGADSFSMQPAGAAQIGVSPDGMLVGRARPASTRPLSHRTPGTDGEGIFVVGDEAVIRGNTIDEHGTGIVVWGATDVVIRTNRVQDSIDDEPEDGIVVIGNASARIVENTITANEDGIVPGGDVTIVRNTIIDNNHDGVDIGPRYRVDARGTARVRVVNNEITANGGYGLFPGSGIRLRGEDWKQANIEIRNNVIRNNVGFGIFHITNNTIVNATNNYWGCGGPSSGLKDPYTDRIANGSGDPVSPGEEPGYTNVHFDPFFERSSCVTGGSTPSPESTTTGMPTATATATATSTAAERTETSTGAVTASPTMSAGTGGGPGAGNGSTAVRTVSGPGENDLGQLETTETPTPPQTPTPTPTATLPPTETPTPRAEPGFGVLAWVVGLVGLVGLLGLRQRRNHEEDG